MLKKIIILVVVSVILIMGAATVTEAAAKKAVAKPVLTVSSINNIQNTVTVKTNVNANTKVTVMKGKKRVALVTVKKSGKVKVGNNVAGDKLVVSFVYNKKTYKKTVTVAGVNSLSLKEKMYVSNVPAAKLQSMYMQMDGSFQKFLTHYDIKTDKQGTYIQLKKKYKDKAKLMMTLQQKSQNHYSIILNKQISAK